MCLHGTSDFGRRHLTQFLAYQQFLLSLTQFIRSTPALIMGEEKEERRGNYLKLNLSAVASHLVINQQLFSCIMLCSW